MSGDGAATPGKAAYVPREPLEALIRRWSAKADEPDRDPYSAAAYRIAKGNLVDAVAAAAAAPQPTSLSADEACRAYEAYVMAAPDDLNFPEWEDLPEWQRQVVRSAAQEAYEVRAHREARAAAAPQPARDPGQAAAPDAWAAWYLADGSSRTMAQDFNESKHDAMRRAFEAGQQAAAAAAARPAPGDEVAERVAAWLYEEFGGYDDWGRAPQRKRDYYLGKARELAAAAAPAAPAAPAVLGSVVIGPQQLPAEPAPAAPGLAEPDLDESLSKHIAVRFPPDMIAVVRHLAEAEGMTVSAWIRREVEREAGRREQAAAPELAAAMAESRRYREALGQVRAIILEGGSSTEGSRLRRSRAVIRRALEGK